MSYKLHWIEENFADYFISGAITKNFDISEKNKELLNLVKENKDIIVMFEDIDQMLVLTGFKEYNEEDDESEDYLSYLLDDEVIEVIEANKEEKHLSLYVGIIGLQYFQFDTLKDLLLLDESEIETLDAEEQEEVKAIQETFENMPEEDKENFFEQELLFYTEEELKAWTSINIK